MRNSRSSLPRLLTLAIPLWALSACFGAPEPPAVFAPPEDASVTDEPDTSGDTGSTATGDVTEDVAQTAEDVTETAEVVTAEDVTETVEDVTETVEDVTETVEDVTEVVDTTDTATDPVETCPAGGAGKPKPANTCVDWICEDGDWTAQEVPANEGNTCESPCYSAAGELTCQSGKCLPTFGGVEDCADKTPNNPCVVTICDPIYGGCGLEVTSPGATCNDDDACTEDDQCESDGTCTGTPKSCSGGATDCAGPSACDPETGACVGAPLGAGTACNDGALDTLNDVCDGEGGCSGTPCAPAAPCWFNNADGNQCNPQPVAAGEACGPGLPCISGACDGDGGCNITVVAGSCHIDGKCVPDGQKVPEDMCLTCDASEVQTEGVVTDCDDSDPCTVDSCDPETGDCSHVLTPADDDNVEVCDGVDNDCDGQTDEGWKTEYCSFDVTANACPALGDLKADNPCLICTAAVEGTDAGWATAETGSVCDDGDENSCTTGVCSGGVCVAGPDVDSVECSCCVSNAKITPGCNDDDVEAQVCAIDAHCCDVNWDDDCAQLASQQGACGPTVCDDELANMDEIWGELGCETPDYNDDECNQDSECGWTLNDAQSETCGIAVCSKLWDRDCDGDDDDDCGAGSPSAGQCTFLPAETIGGDAGNSCDDGDVCNGADDQCVMGVCLGAGDTGYEGAGESLECGESGSPCQTSYCDPDTGCESEETVCDDGVECTEDECDDDQGCLYIAEDDLCDDGTGCTVDTCVPTEGCVNTPDDKACDDEIDCTLDTCALNEGCANTPDDNACDDESDCTVDTCVLTEGCANTTSGDPEISCDGVDNDCDGATDEVECDDEDACTDDSCGAGGCVYTPNQACDDLECTVQEDCDFAGCQGDCDLDGVCTYASDSLCASPLCTLDYSGPLSQTALLHPVGGLFEYAYPHSTMIAHQGVLYIPVNEGTEGGEMGDPGAGGGGPPGMNDDGGLSAPTFEIFRYDISDDNELPTKWFSWSGADLGLGGTQAGAYSPRVPAMQGREGWLDIAVSQSMSSTPEDSGGVSICSVDVSSGMQSGNSPNSDDCSLWQDYKSDTLTTLANSHGFVLAGVATYEFGDDCSFECSEGLVCVDQQCSTPDSVTEARNYLVSLATDGDGNITGEEADKLTSSALLEATTQTLAGQFFAPSDIAIDQPTNGAATRIIVAGRLRQSPTGYEEYYDSSKSNRGGVVLFGNLSAEGEFNFTNSADGHAFGSSDFGNLESANNDLTTYEPVQIIVNRRADRSIAYVLWSPDSANGLTCDSDSGDVIDCESILTAHDLTDPTTPVTLGQSPVYSDYGRMQFGAQMAMSLLGSPLGTTRIAIGAGELFTVSHTYEPAGQSTGTFTGSMSVNWLSQDPAATWGLVQTDSRLMWLGEDLSGADGGVYQPFTVYLYEPTCYTAPN